jgi:hypothetical protein
LAAQAPAHLTLDVGHYHVVVEKFRGYNESHADIDVSPGRVLIFKANLSQGQFMAFLRVTANVRGAYVYLDPMPDRAPEWGVVPHGELVAAGRHRLRVEAPGFVPTQREFTLAPGDQKELMLTLTRASYGRLRLDANAREIKVFLNGSPRGTWKRGQPALEIEAPGGPTRLLIQAPGRKPLVTTVRVPRGQVLPVHALMVPTYPRGAAWTQAVLGGVLLSAAVWAGIESNHRYQGLADDRRRGTLEEGDQRVFEGKLLAGGADVGFLLGGVLGALALYNFVRDPWPESSHKTEAPTEFPDSKKNGPSAVFRPLPSTVGVSLCGHRLGGSL